eukprot:m.470292 g.470292  ORF g.470292 m.470292 type:complete len:325 (-) comp29637_c0_seq1:94-1068(-)
MLVLAVLAATHLTSRGDREIPFRRCSQNCRRLCNGVQDPELEQWCENLGVAPSQHSTAPWDRLLWSCFAECEYRCMWWAEANRKSTGQAAVQYYGKWPFTRFLGLQEPLSVLFSVANFLAHVRGLAAYRAQTAESGYQFRGMWTIHGLSIIVAWLCAAVFHTRDTYITEKLDYFSATAGIMAAPLASVARMLPARCPRVLLLGIALAYAAGYVRYVYVMMSARTFDYAFHGRYNALWVGLMTPLWCTWWLWHRSTHRHAWKAALFTVAIPICASAELLEFAPLGTALDAHALWHGLTAPLALLWWSFLTDDARFETARSKPHAS